MLFLFIFLHFLSTGHAAVGDACNFASQTDGCKDGTSGKLYKCVKKGGTLITKEAEWTQAGCAANEPFKSCICLDTFTKKAAGTALADFDLSTAVCQSDVAYREITDDGTKLALDAFAQGVNPTTATATPGVNSGNAFPGSATQLKAIAGTKAYCGIPEGEFCLVTTTGSKKTDHCMPGLHCYTGFGDPVAENGICMDDDTIFTKNAWLTKFKTDTLAAIADNKVIADDNTAKLKKNADALAANKTAIELAQKTSTDWFRGATSPGDDVPDFKERGKLLLTTTIFIGIFVLPSVLYLVWKQCSQPPQKRRRANVKAADSDELSDES